MRNAALVKRDEEIAIKLRAGVTEQQIADEYLLSLSSVATIRRRNGLLKKRGKKAVDETAKHEAMRDQFVSGKTLQEIGVMHGITRERVRQILKQKFALNGDYGGKAIKVFLNGIRINKSSSKRALNVIKQYGCSMEKYRELTGNEFHCMNRPAYRYRIQKNNARSRGIEFLLTFPEWWAIWQGSGHYSDSNRMGGYCMARLADDGPYAVNNVYICTAAQNCHDQYFSGKERKRKIEIHATPRVIGDSYFPDSIGMHT